MISPRGGTAKRSKKKEKKEIKEIKEKEIKEKEIAKSDRNSNKSTRERPKSVGNSSNRKGLIFVKKKESKSFRTP